MDGEGDSPNSIRLTFDDGYTDIFDPVLALCEAGIRPLICIPTACIGKRNRWDWSSRYFRSEHLDEGQIRQLHESGAEIGSHGQTHSAMTILNDQALSSELTDSKKTLEDITGAGVTSLSFPFGRHNLRVIDACQEAGYDDFYALGIITPNCEEFPGLHRRTTIYSSDTFYSLHSKLVGKGRIEAIKSNIINRLAGGTIIISPPQINPDKAENS